MPAEVEEAFVDPHLGQAQHAGKDLRHQLLGGSARRLDSRRAGGLPLRRRQRPPVHLAAGGERQGFQDDEGRGHHRLRQPLPQEGPQLLGGRGRVARDDIAHQGQPARPVLPRQHHRVADLAVQPQGRLDLPRLDTEPADLDLVVDPAQELDVARRQPAHQVAGAIKPGARLGREGVRHELLRRQPRPAQVAAGHARPAYAELAGHPDRRRPAPRVQHIDRVVGGRPADRHPRAAPQRAARPHVEDQAVDRRLGGTVAVIEMAPLPRRFRQPFGLAAGQGLAAQVQPPQRRQLHARLRHRLEERRRRVHRVDLPLQRHPAEGFRVVDLLRPRNAEGAAGDQRGEDLPHPEVEGVRQAFQHPRRRVEGEVLPAPGQHRDEVAVRDADPLRLTRRARGVDHVRQALRRQRGLGGRRRGRLEPLQAAHLDIRRHVRRDGGRIDDLVEADHLAQSAAACAEPQRPFEIAPLRDQHLDAAIGRDHGDALVRLGGAQGHERRARLEDAQQAHRQIGARVGHQADQRLTRSGHAASPSSPPDRTGAARSAADDGCSPG